MRVGLIGAGNVAQMAQLPTLATRPDVTLAGLVTRTPETAEANLRRWPIARTYATAAEMLESATLDAIFVLKSPRRALRSRAGGFASRRGCLFREAAGLDRRGSARPC